MEAKYILINHDRIFWFQMIQNLYQESWQIRKHTQKTNKSRGDST